MSRKGSLSKSTLLTLIKLTFATLPKLAFLILFKLIKLTLLISLMLASLTITKSVFFFKDSLTIQAPPKLASASNKLALSDYNKSSIQSLEAKSASTFKDTLATF